MTDNELRQWVVSQYFGWLGIVNEAMARNQEGSYVPTWDQMGKSFQKLEAYVTEGVIPTND